MNRPISPRWPLVLWAVQLLPGLGLVAIGVARTRVPHIALDPLKTYAAIGVGIGWSSIVVAVLALPTARRWVVMRRKQLSLAGASALLAAIVVDVALTVSGAVPTISAQRERSVSYALGWFTRLRMVSKDVSHEDGTRLHINRRGFRGEEIDVERAPGRKRVIVLGGSQVFDYRGNWPRRLQERLAAEDLDVEVINAGVAGHDTTDSLGKLLTDLWTLRPDIVVLCQTWNDTKWIGELTAKNPYRGLAPLEPVPWRPDWRLYPSGVDALLSWSAFYRHLRWGVASILYTREGNGFARVTRGAVESSDDAIGLRQFRLNVELIVELAESVGAEAVLCKQARLATRNRSGPAQDAARRYGIETTGLSHQRLMSLFEACHGIIAEIADARKLTLVDMHEHMSGRMEYFDDGIHFSPAGSRAAASLVAAAIAPSLRAVDTPGNVP